MNEKVALVTGANKGIGFGIAKYLGLSGWKVIIGARNAERAAMAIQKLTASGIDVLGWVNIELKDIAGIEQAAMEVSDKYSNLSLLVNNAGIPGNMGVDSRHTDLSDIRETLDVNFVGSKPRSDSQRHRSFRNQSLLASVGLCGQQGCTKRNDGRDGCRVPAE